MEEKEEFFDKRDLRRAGRQVKNMDTNIPKKKHFFAKFLLVFLILLIAGGCVYYFVIDTPKNFYTKNIDKVSNVNKVIDSKESNSLNYSIDALIKSGDKDTMKILGVFNQIKINGTIKLENKELTGSNNIKYKNDDLIDIAYSLDAKENIAYFKFDNIIDKTIKMNLDDEEEETTYSVNKDDYETVITSYIKHFKEVLENAKYERKITKVNKSFVFKDTVLLDEKNEKDLLTKLLHDDDFLRALSKIEGSSVSDISDEINEEISSLEKEENKISIYRIPIKNEVLKVEIKDELDDYVITKEKDTYNYDIKTNEGNKYKGFLKTNKTKDETRITFNFEDIKEDTELNINLTYSNNEFKKVDIDKDKAIEYTELTEQDILKIADYMSKNKAFNVLLTDLGISEGIDELAPLM